MRWYLHRQQTLAGRCMNLAATLQRRCRVTWHITWFRWHAWRQEFVAAARHRALMRKAYD